MDVEYLKYLLSYEDDETHKIQTHDHISAELIELLRTNIKNMPRCFAKVTDNSSNSWYTVECVCSQCGVADIPRLSKTKTLDYIKTSNYVCPSCKKREKEQNKRAWEEKNAMYKQQKAQNTPVYIENYLNPNKQWSENTTYREMSSAILYTDVDWGAVAEHIKNMPYNEFLQTPYWYFVSKSQKHRAQYKCELCGAVGKLHVHHKSYEHHGWEHTHDGSKDLIVLCNNCHAKFHDKVVH